MDFATLRGSQTSSPALSFVAVVFHTRGQRDDEGTARMGPQLAQGNSDLACGGQSGTLPETNWRASQGVRQHDSLGHHQRIKCQMSRFR